MTILDDLLAHTVSVTGLPLAALRANTLDLTEAREHLADAERALDAEAAAAHLDAAIQALVTARHNLAPGPVLRYLPELRRGLVFMEPASDRWSDHEWRRSRRHPDWYVDQHGVPCDPRALPASLVVVEASAERGA